MKNNLLILVLFITCLASVYGQSSQIYSYESVLPSDTVTCMVEDANGNIMIGTTNGLVSYNGSEFSVITTSDGLIGSNINHIYVASDGKLYVATTTGLSIRDNNSWQNDFIGSDIRKIAVTNDGKIWYSTSTNALLVYDNGESTMISDDYGFSNGITNIYVDRSQNVWVCDNGNLVEISANGKIKSFEDDFFGMTVYGVYQRYNGDLLAATNHGIKSYNYISWTSIEGISMGAAAVCEDYEQNIIFGNLNGVYRYNGTSCEMLNNSFSVNALLVSGPQSKRIWCSNYQNGIAIMDFNGNAETYHTNRTLLNHSPNFIWGDNDGNIGIAGVSGINIVSDYTWESYSRDLQNLNVKAMNIQNDTVWVGTENFILRKVGRNVSPVAATNVNAIVNDANTIYAATNLGLLKIIGGVVVDTIESTSVIKDLVCSNGIYVIAGNSIYRLNNGDLEQVSTTVSLNDNSRFVKTSTGNIFITTDGGIASFNPIASPTTTELPEGFSSTVLSAVACGNNVYVLASNGKIYEYSDSWREVMSGSYTKIASAGNGIIWALLSDGNVARICIDCNSTFTVSSQPETCDGSNDASLTISAIGATSYSIDNGDTWQTSETFNNISGGYKHLLARNSEEKIIADSVIFLEYSTALYDQGVTYIQPECYGELGSLVLSNIGTASFVWENSNTTMTERANLESGNYAVTITNSTCSRSFAQTVATKTQVAITENIDNVDCFNTNSGRITLTVSGGTSPYSYLWSNNAEVSTIENLLAGEYSCTVTDRNFCTVSGTFTVSQPSAALTLQSESNNVSCFGANNGSISLDINGGTSPYSYLWDDNSNDGNREGLSPGDYSLTLTDANGCTATLSHSISEPEALNVSGNATNISCYGRNDGAISISVLGGTEPYAYQWNGQSAEANQTNLSQGDYSLVVTDANTCTATFFATITEPNELVAISNITPILCAGANNAELSASATGGTGVYAQYFWFREENPNSPVCVQTQYQNVEPGNYLLVVKDSHNCTDTVSVVVEDAPAHNFEMTVTDALCNGSSDGSISISIDGGNGEGFSFSWSDNVSYANMANSLRAGRYIITVTDSNECETVLDTIVGEPDMQLIGSFSDLILCEGQSFTLDAGNYASYEWNNGMTTQTITVGDEGEYSVTVTDSQGCRLYDVSNVSIRIPYTGDKLALATVTDSSTVLLRWNKTENQGTASYRIYRDSGEGFVNIATVGFNAEAMYEDTTVDASVRYYSYKITAVSNCGDESEIDEFHRTIVLAATCDQNNVCNLNWSPYMGVTETFSYILAGDSPESLEIVDSVLFSTYNYVQMNQYENGTYYRIMIKMTHPLVTEEATYDRIYSNIVRCGGSDDPEDPPVMAEEFGLSDISAYPNPFGDEITITFDGINEQNVSYDVVDVLGRVVIEGKTNDNKIEFGEELNPGIYVVRLYEGNNVHSVKISKQ